MVVHMYPLPLLDIFIFHNYDDNKSKIATLKARRMEVKSLVIFQMSANLKTSNGTFTVTMKEKLCKGIIFALEILFQIVKTLVFIWV